MPKLDVNIKTSLERTGKECRDVHEWIDNDDEKKLDRHDITKIPDNIKEVERQWGEEGVREFVRHIHDDIRKRTDDTPARFGVK